MDPGWAAPIAIGAIAVITLIYKVGTWVGGVNEHKKTVGAFMEEIRNDIKVLLRRVPPPTVVGGSPLRLTDLGEKVSANIGAVAWAKQTAEAIADQVVGKRPDEIEEFCFAYVYGDGFQPDNEFDTAIRVAAYENGIDRAGVLDVLAITLRDELLTREGP